MQYARLLLNNQATAVLRDIPFVIRNSSGVEVTGEVITGAELQVSKNGAAFANFTGTVTEVGLGLYIYRATQAELDTLGTFDIRINDGTNPTLHVICQVIATDVEGTAAGVWGTQLEGTLTAQDLMRLLSAALFGELSGAATTAITIKKADDNTTTRITSTVDANGNRTFIVLSP